VDYYASLFADLARTIHGIHVTEEDGFPDATARLRKYITGGIGKEDEALAEKCMKLIDTISDSDTLTHGDFHTNNVFLLNDEPLLIDLDRLSSGHPMIEISDLYYFYNILGEDDPAVIEDFMGFSYDTAKKFFEVFLRKYLGTEDKKKLDSVKEKAAFICDVRITDENESLDLAGSDGGRDAYRHGKRTHLAGRQGHPGGEILGHRARRFIECIVAVDTGSYGLEGPSRQLDTFGLRYDADEQVLGRAGKGQHYQQYSEYRP
jgi:hypothetical protein